MIHRPGVTSGSQSGSYQAPRLTVQYWVDKLNLTDKTSNYKVESNGLGNCIKHWTGKCWSVEHCLIN